MKVDLNVNVHHLTRVEGHGNIRVRVRAGKVVEARWQVVETPRYFEVMLKGKHFSTAPMLTARICGICSIGHCLASLRATERAFGVEISPTAALLRRLAKHGETLQSHYLHLFFLAAPDFLGLTSALPLIESRPDIIEIARQLKGTANRLCDLVAGRTTHPVSLQVGGVAMMPNRDALKLLRDEVQASLTWLTGDIRELFAGFEIPSFVRETEFVSLKGETSYPFIGGRLVSTDGAEREESGYRDMTNEYTNRDNTSKWTRLSRESFAVGALARFNNNSAHLHVDALALASDLGLEPVCHNPFVNNVAQLVECVHVSHEIVREIDQLLAEWDDETMRPVNPRARTGVGAVEVPRGILYHEYEYDDEGRIVKADCVIPTTQNNANIHYDLHALAEQFAVRDMTDERLSLLCEMLVRAYDPCISCSVH